MSARQNDQGPDVEPELIDGEMLIDLVERSDMGPEEPNELEDTESEDDQDNVRRPVGDGEYVVKADDCLSSIAVEHGLFWETIWNDQANAEVKRVRKDPNVLLPGDRLHVRAIQPKQEDAQTDQTHTFRRKGVPEKVHIRLLDDEDKPLAGVPYVLDIDGKLRQGVTTDNGEVIESIPPNARKGRIILDLEGMEEEIPLALGELDPLDELSGVQARLNNLGFQAGEEDGQWSPQTAEAVRSFQERYELEPTGKLDETTRKKIGEKCGD